MNKKTKKILGVVALAAVGLYLYNKSQAAGAASYYLPGAASVTKLPPVAASLQMKIPGR